MEGEGIVKQKLLDFFPKYRFQNLGIKLNFIIKDYTHPEWG